MKQIHELLRVDPARWKMFWVDTLSMTLFSWIVGSILDIYLVHLSFTQMLKSRCIATLINFFIARIYSLYNAWLRSCISNFKKRNLFIRYVVDTFAYASFQAPTSYAFLRIVGASHKKAFEAILVLIMLSFVLGFAYSRFNVIIRRTFRVPLVN